MMEKFSLGMFSIAGCQPFAGMLLSGKVLAVSAINRAHVSNAVALHGDTSIKALLLHWEHNFPVLEDIAVALAGNPESDRPEIAHCRALMIDVETLAVHAPITEPGQILMARANYRKHIVELSLRMGRGKGDSEAERRADLEAMVEHKATEGDPFFWVKTNNAIAGPYDAIKIPEATSKACLLYTSPSPRDCQ